MGNERFVRAAGAVVEGIEPRRLMSTVSPAAVLGDYEYNAEYDVYASGGGIVSYVYQQGGTGMALMVNQFTAAADDPATEAVESGLTPRGTVQVVTLTSNASFQAIDANAGGQTVVAWSERVGSNFTIKARTIAPDGGLGGTVTVASGKADWVGAVNVAIDGAGNYNVVYAVKAGGNPSSNVTDVMLNRVVSGRPGAKAVAVGKTSGTNIVEAFTSIDAAHDGRFVIAWSNTGAPRVQRYTAGGAKDGSVIVVDRSDRLYELVEGIDITPDGSRFIFTCIADVQVEPGVVDRGHFARIFSGSGVQVGADVDVAAGSATAIGADGSFATTWNSFQRTSAENLTTETRRSPGADVQPRRRRAGRTRHGVQRDKDVRKGGCLLPLDDHRRLLCPRRHREPQRRLPRGVAIRRQQGRNRRSRPRHHRHPLIRRCVAPV